MKAILVIDEMPTECIECSFSHVHVDDEYEATHCILMGRKNENGVNTRAKWCPLKPLPERWIPQLNGLSIEQQIRNIDFAGGWNTCLERIEK